MRDHNYRCKWPWDQVEPVQTSQKSLRVLLSVCFYWISNLSLLQMSILSFLKDFLKAAFQVSNTYTFLFVVELDTGSPTLCDHAPTSPFACGYIVIHVQRSGEIDRTPSYGLNGIHTPKNAEVLILSTCQCDLIWKLGQCKWSQTG